MITEQDFFEEPPPDSQKLRESFLAEFQADFRNRWEEMQQFIVEDKINIRRMRPAILSCIKSSAFSPDRKEWEIHTLNRDITEQWVEDNQDLVAHVLNVSFTEIDTEHTRVFPAMEEFVARRKLAAENYYDMVRGWRSARDASSAPVENESSPDSTNSGELEVNPDSEVELVGNDREQVELTVLERRVLNVIAHFPAGCTKYQITPLAGYDVSGFELQPTLCRLKKLEYIDERSIFYSITELGRDANGTPVPLLKGKALRNCWRPHLNKYEVSVLDALVKKQYKDLTRQQVAELAGYSPKTASFSAALSNLRNLGLVIEFSLRVDLKD